ncbi:MAG: formate dehydrogenase accessory sulfurtransferase FdhD [Candidatus Meridianibacter frigidus]|nr:MAG: formate dehydrogenase accessory sulfurtransferase FdhD [Candidatus Eremiobacteraeota bacterium]
MSTSSVDVLRIERATRERGSDDVATEEPLQIRYGSGDGALRDLAITMRTPGNDFELSAGFVLSEGLIAQRSDLHSLTYCIDPHVDLEQRFNIVNVVLEHARAPTRELERHFTVASSCGVCGKAHLEALEMRGVQPVQSDLVVQEQTLRALPDALRAHQRVFSKTGGLHASALFTAAGEMEVLREDVGRHNATDKVIGWALMNGRLPATQSVLLVSGRSSFEIVQKAAVAGICMVASVSAPSSLAIETAKRFGITLVGFLRDGRFNVYTHPGRVL